MQQELQKFAIEWSFAAKLRELRGDRRLTQAVMADRLGVAKRTYIAWEHGSAKPTVDVVCRIEDEFEVSAIWLFDRDNAVPITAAGASRLERIFNELYDHARCCASVVSAKAVLRLANHIARGAASQDFYALERAKLHLSTLGSDEDD